MFYPLDIIYATAVRNYLGFLKTISIYRSEHKTWTKLTLDVQIILCTPYEPSMHILGCLSTGIPFITLRNLILPEISFCEINFWVH